jgi:hypothetical protein
MGDGSPCVPRNDEFRGNYLRSVADCRRPRNLEAGKLGLSPGGFFKISADTGFGNNAFRDSGAIMPANTDRPRAGQSTGLIDLRDT